MKVVWGNNANETRGKRFTSILIAALLCIIVFVPVAALALAEEQGDTPDALPQAEESEAAALPLDEEPGDEAAALPLEEETIVKAEAAPVKKQAMLRTSYAIDLSTIAGGGVGYTYDTSRFPYALRFNESANGNEYTIIQSLGSTNVQQITVGEKNVEKNIETKITINGINVVNDFVAGEAVFDVLPGAKVTLVLKDDNYLTKPPTNTATTMTNAALCVRRGAEITIRGTGTLTAKAPAHGGYVSAGIGGGNGDGGGTINIESGTIVAEGGEYGAGIGGGSGGNVSTINISGGNVTATGGRFGAGIGSANGGAGGVINISGGTVTATGGEDGAGIGTTGVSNGGTGTGVGGTINITGGTVIATGNGAAAGIGSGNGGHGYNITIGGDADVTAIGGGNAVSAPASGVGGAGIGSGHNGSDGKITIKGNAVVKATGGNPYGAGIGAGYNNSSAAMTIAISENAYVEAQGGTSTNSGGGAGISATPGGTIEISGGTVEARGGRRGAGIGGSSGEAGGAIHITGTANVTARGGEMDDPKPPEDLKFGGAGIGGGGTGKLDGTGGGGPATLTLDASATVRAYSKHSDRPAIHAVNQSSNIGTGTGYYVNAYFGAPLSTTADTPLRVSPGGSTPPVSGLSLPANYACFAYTTGAASPQTDNIFAYEADGTTFRGVVVKGNDNDPQIGSVHDASTLKVKLLTGFAVGTPSATDIKLTSATLVSTGQYVATETFSSAAGGFRYSTSGSVDGSGRLNGTDVKTVSWGAFSTDPISASINGLSEGGTYYVQTYLNVTSGSQTISIPSSVISFTTLKPTLIDLSTTTTGGIGYGVDGSTTANRNGVNNPNRTLTLFTDVNGGAYRITQSYGPGTSIFKRIIVVTGLNAEIVIEGIDVTSKAAGEPVFALQGNAQVNLKLTGANRLTQAHTNSAGNNAGLNVPGAASVTISGGGSLTVRGGARSAAIGGGSGGGAGKIAITGNATVTATGGAGGAGIGGGSGGAAATLTIDASATIRAYATGGSNRPALHAAGQNDGDGYYVNAYFDAPLSVAESTELRVYPGGGTTPMSSSLSLPAGYACFAYTTGSTTRTDKIVAYKGSAGATLLGTVARVANNMPQIGSVRDGSTLNVKLQTASLTIANTVAGDYADKTKDFTFTVKLMYADGTLITTRDLTLKHGQSITISDILVGGMVSVTETNYDGYTVTFRDSETPDMEYAGDTLTRSMTGNLGTFTFTNTRETINPTGVGGQDADAALPVILSALLLSAASYLGVIIRRAKRMVETEK